MPFPQQFVNDDLPDGYEGPVQYINWNGYKIAYLDSGGLTPHFFDQIAARRKNNQAIIIIVTAEAGQGKSYMALRFAQIFDTKFHILDIDKCPPPEEDPSQTVFERPHFHYLIGNETPLDDGQCVVSDEAQYAIGARKWYEKLQLDLVESIESVRSKGLIILIVALNLDLIDNIIRKFVLTYMLHVEDRGRAVIYRLFMPRFGKDMHKRRLGELHLRLPDVEKCTHSDCLRCEFSGIRRKQWKDRKKWKEIGFKPCMSLRAIYERRKKDFVSTRSDLAKEKATKKRQHTDKDMAQSFHDVHLEDPGRTQYNKKGDIDISYIQIVLEDKLGVSVGTGKAYQLRTRLYIENPELKKEKEKKEE